MTRNEKELYRNSPTIGTYCISNWGGIAVKGIEYGIDDYIIVEWFDVSIHRRRIDYTRNGRPYFRLGNARYYLDEFMR
jgi:hypothetical protein